MPKRTKKPVTKTKSKTLEIPITALPPETMPDGELGRQWNELYPPGTEVIVDDCKTTEPNVKSSRLARTAAPAVHDYKRNAGLRDCLRLDGDITDISLRNFIFPASAFPELTKELRNKQILEQLGMKPKRPATKATSPAPSVSSAAGTQDAEERKRQELLEAYKKRDEIQHGLYRAKMEATQLRASLASMNAESKVAESLLRDLASIDGAGESWSVETVSNFLIAVLGQNTRKCEEVKQKLSHSGGKARGLHAKLSKLNNEIRLLFERGPNPQQIFDMDEAMEEIEERVDGKTAAMGR